MSTGNQPPTVVSLGEDVLERMVLAVEKVRQRLQRATGALETRKIPYAVVGGNAVAAWVAKVDPGAARNTVDVDLMINRADFDAVQEALEDAGFVYQNVFDVDMFLDGKDGRPRDAVHILYASEKVREEYSLAAPDLAATDLHETIRLLDLKPLVTMKLTSFRDKDRTHLRDMIDVGLIDQSWTSRLPTQLAGRLQVLLDDPHG